MRIFLKKIRFFWELMLFIAMFFVCQYTLKGVGAGSSEKNACIFLIFIILLSFSPFSFWLIAFPVFIFMALYIPIGIIFSLPTYQTVASVISTNILETKEFFSQLSIYNFAYPIVLICLFVLFRFFYVKKEITLHNSKLLLIIFLLLSFFALKASVFYSSLYDSIIRLKSEGVKISSYKDGWGSVSASDKKYDRYVIVIGESARVDYINAFGYPLKNSPFMSSHGLSVKGLISGGSNTVASLSNMLTRNVDGEPDYSKNIVDLANDAGLETYWISNQGFVSDFDTPISIMANLSKHKNFIKYGSYNSKNTSDFMLVNLLNDVIKRPLNKKELIIIHLYGSHPKPCSRIDDFNGGFYSDDSKLVNVACYVNSIKKTDELLNEFNGILTESYIKHGLTYSMVYFSDHGLVHDTSGSKINLLHGESIHSYSIPLFKISSDNTSRDFCESPKSGIKFIDGLSNWIGIKNESLDPNYSLFDCKEDYSVNNYINKIKSKFRNDQGAISNLQEK